MPKTVSPHLVRISEDYGAVGDDTDFLFRLGMLEGHLIVGHDLLEAHKQDLALPHFGHPVRELYDDIADYLDKKKFPPFDRQLIKLEAAVASDPYSASTQALYDAAIKTLHDARATVPVAVRDSVPEMIRVCSNTIDAASGEFGESLDHGRIETLVEYHDSRGYLSYVAQELASLMRAHPDAADQGMLARFKAVFAKAQYIVEPLIPNPEPRASVGQYRAIAAEAADVAKQQ